MRRGFTRVIASARDILAKAKHLKRPKSSGQRLPDKGRNISVQFSGEWTQEPTSCKGSLMPLGAVGEQFAAFIIAPNTFRL